MKNKIIYFFYFPLVIIIKLISLKFQIRFGLLDCQRLGHLCLFDLYLSKKKVLKIKSMDFVILINKKKISNKHLLELYSKKYNFYNSRVMIWLYLSLIYFKYNNLIIKFTDQDIKYAYKNKLSYIKSFFESNSFNNYLSYKNKVICIHNRDSFFLNSKFNKEDFSYHDHRDFSIKNMHSAMKFLVGQKCSVIRVGRGNHENLDLNNSDIIDYSNSCYKSDVNDLENFYKCDIYIGSDSGIFTLAPLFNKPFSFINFPSIDALINKYYWNAYPSIFKLIVNSDNDQILSLNDIFKYNYGSFLRKDQFISNGIKLKENSSQDILEHTKDIFNIDVSTSYDQKIINNFLDLYFSFQDINPYIKKNAMHFINVNFLKKYFYKELL